MSLPETPSAPAENSDFQYIFDEAVKEYNKKTKGNITSDPLLVELGSCTSVDDILAVFHRRDEDLRASHCNKFLIPIINVLCKVSPVIGDGVGLVGVKFPIRNQFAKLLYHDDVFRHSHMQKHQQMLFALELESSSRSVHTDSPWIHCFDAKVVQAAKAVHTDRETLADLFARIRHFFARLEVHTKTEVPLTTAMKEIIIEIMAEVLSILAIATKEIKRPLRSELIPAYYNVHS
jgi:hypothetical protein